MEHSPLEMRNFDRLTQSDSGPPIQLIQNCSDFMDLNI
jgi:hypothetical protein